MGFASFYGFTLLTVRDHDIPPDLSSVTALYQFARLLAVSTMMSPGSHNRDFLASAHAHR